MSILKRLNTDGVVNVITLFTKKFQNFIYRPVNTTVFELSFTNDKVQEFGGTDLDQLEFTMLKPGESIFHLSNNDIQKKFAGGGTCLVLIVKGCAAGYLWFFSDNYYVQGVGNINLKERNAIWVGPAFVHKNYRGNGYNKLLVNKVFKSYKLTNQSCAMTSINSDNIASIRSFESMGFKKASELSSYYLFGRMFESSKEE